jgi:flagellar basal-body rod protein FlgF
MENISYIGLSQQLALQQQMEMTASNIANVSTPGYKAQAPLFADYMSKPKDGSAINQVVNAGSYRDLAPGTMAQTFNQLDVAIAGDGYFAVETPQGVRYTRDGSFGMNANREIVTKAGYRVMSEGGTITIPPEVTSFTITPEGAITTNEGEIARLKVTDVDKPQMMKREGDNLYSLMEGAVEKPVERVRVVQGAVEQSNVNPVLEMNKMIQLLRMFQATQRMLQTDHDRQRGMIEKLTKV